MKKEFQQMILDNVVICDEVDRLIGEARRNLKEENDNTIFGLGVFAVIQ